MMIHKIKRVGIILCILTYLPFNSQGIAQPRSEDKKKFVDLSLIEPSIIVDLRYFTPNNFVGIPIDGYQANKCLLTKMAAVALKRVQKKLKEMGLSLRVYDCYRPQRAVDHFVRWQKDRHNVLMKKIYYPELKKSELFELGYIAYKSGHSRGSTVDLTIDTLDMGSSWDFFGSISHTFSSRVTLVQRAHRLLLKTLMEGQGYVNYKKEWWHFTLNHEPFSETYFDFTID